ncbi:MAG: hypothetical protein AB8B56_07235 [Crocinitomicaceae bacterium]
MKAVLLSLLLFPILSFSQEVVTDTKDLSRKDKKNIDESTVSMCNCIEEQINTLHPKTIEVMRLIAEKGEAAAISELETMMEEMEPEEVKELLNSFSKMESGEFSEQISVCNYIEGLSQDIQDQINASQGPAYDYFMTILGSEEACELTNYVYGVGLADEE